MPPAVVQPVSLPPAAKAERRTGWGNTFPESVDTVGESKKFLGRCLYLTFASILHSRKLMPAQCFKKRVVKDIVSTHVMNLAEPLGVRMANKFRGAQLAMDEGYLKELMIVVSRNEDDHDDALEVFTWQMSYADDGSCMAQFTDGDKKVHASLHYRGMDHVKSQTRALLVLARKLCRELLAPLPEDAFATLRITYTDSTPKGYQAEGFYRSETLFDLDPDAKEVHIGGLATPFHKFHFSVKSIYIDDEYTVGERLREHDGLDDASLNNSLNNSFGSDSGGEKNDAAASEVAIQKAGRAAVPAGVSSNDKSVVVDTGNSISISSRMETRGSSPAPHLSSSSITPPLEPRSRRNARAKKRGSDVSTSDGATPPSTNMSTPVVAKKSAGRTTKTDVLTPGSTPPRAN